MTLRQRFNLVKDWSARNRVIAISLIFQFVVLVSTVAYVIVAHKQLGQIEIQNTFNHDALTTLQRAFVFETDIQVANGTDLVPPLPNGAKVSESSVTIRFENSGPTPATNVVENASVCAPS
jgi:hypothetical protein